MINLSVGKLFHHDLEFFEVDLAVSVDVHLVDNVPPDLLLFSNVVAKESCDLARINRAATIFVEETEGGPQVWLIEQFILIDGGCAPLSKVDGATAVSIRLVEDLVGAFIHDRRVFAGVLSTVALDELFTLDHAIAILVKLVEGDLQLPLLLFRRHVA